MVGKLLKMKSLENLNSTAMSAENVTNVSFNAEIRPNIPRQMVHNRSMKVAKI